MTNTPIPPDRIIVTHRIKEFKVFEVKEEELTIIESKLKSAPTTLSFATLFVSVAITCLVTAATTTGYKSDGWETFFSGIGWSGLIFGIILFVLWFFNRSSGLKLIRDIKERE